MLATVHVEHGDGHAVQVFGNEVEKRAYPAEHLIQRPGPPPTHKLHPVSHNEFLTQRYGELDAL